MNKSFETAFEFLKEKGIRAQKVTSATVKHSNCVIEYTDEKGNPRIAEFNQWEIITYMAKRVAEILELHNEKERILQQRHS